ncbi:ABC transporter permease [Deinococcus malanensis]|uniref:ABC transporter permease n=1 Tax=Deinococcus malanensis TaxID=1706855 RepID=A0ABQ2F3S5_9DEIO|nr:ABC transporter permease subunit [Deinococcus malanensis]GGK38912.1 ABC transporter permease [Deinococcus malanensis]
MNSRSLLETGPTFLPTVSRVVTVLALLILVGLLPWLSGRDPALSILRARSGEQDATPEALNAIRIQLGLDLGPAEQLGRYVQGWLHGDPGTSWISGAPVLPGLLTALGTSLTLMTFALMVALVITLLVCLPTLQAGLNGRVRRSGGVGGVTMTALPEFLLASLLLVVFAVGLNWFPAYGWRGIEYAVLPTLALGVPAGGYLGRLFTDGLQAAFRERWVATWVVAGFSRAQIAAAVLRRAAPGLLPQLGLVMVGLTGGAVAVEQVFAIPGVGRATLNAAVAQDLPALQTGVLLLLLLAVTFGSVAQAGRLLLLGRALRLGSLPVPAREDAPIPRHAWLLPGTAAALLLLLVMVGLPRDPYTSAFDRLQFPMPGLPLGADGTGRDVLARVAHGAISTAGLAFLVVGLSLVMGVVLGLASRITIGLIEVANALPPVLVGLLVTALVGPSASGAVLAVAAVAWAPLAAHTAALTADVQAQPHVRLAPMLGVGPVRQLTHLVLPAVMGPVLRHALLRLPGIALSLAALGFLGLGSRPPAPEWGLVLAEGLPYLERAPWAVLTPVVALLLLSVLAVSLSSLSRGRAPGEVPSAD